jgi:hypothetical protein
MNAYLGAILFLFITFVLFYFAFQLQEGFESTVWLPGFLESYQAWRKRHVEVMEVWKKGLITAVGLERPAPTSGSAVPPPPTVAEMNQYVTLLSQKQGQRYLPVQEDADQPPEKPDMVALQAYLSSVDAGTYRRSVEWLNQQLEQSFAKLGSALRGGKEGFMEGYAGPTQCPNIAGCLEEHPEEVDRLLAVLEGRRQKRAESQQAKMKELMDAIVNDKELTTAMAKNKELVEKAKSIENQATSGQLLQQLNLPSEPSVSYTLPEGANQLADLQRTDPARYKELQQRFGQLTSLKTTLDQINRNLR